MDKVFHSLARYIERIPWWIVALAIILSFGAIPGALALKTDTSLNTLVPSGSQMLTDTRTYQRQFGGEPVTILLTGPVDHIFSTGNLQKLGQLEQAIASSPDTLSIYGPATIMNQAVATATSQMQTFQGKMNQDLQAAAQGAKQAAAAQGLGTAEQEQAAEAARQQVMQQYQPYLNQYQQMGIPSLDNPVFVASVLHNTDGTINSQLASLVPDSEHAMIVVTPRISSSNSDSSGLLDIINDQINKVNLAQVNTTVVSDTGMINAISSSLKSNMILLLGLAVLVMIVILFVLFRVRWRLLSLLMVGVGALWTFGIMGYISVPLSMATMAILPILIGLGIDYPIQFHNRYQEETARNRTVKEALIATVSRMAPAVGVALIATIIGFLTLYVSDIPMIRDFGTILAVGVVLCFLVALFVLSSILYLSQRKTTGAKPVKPAGQNPGWLEKALHKTSSAAIKRPLLVISIAIVLGVAGGAIDHWLPTNTDYEQLIPQNLPEVVSMRELRSLTGVSGELHLLVQADDLTQPGALDQLKAFQDEELAKHPEFVSTNGLVSTVYQAAGGTVTSQTQVQGVLAGLPEQVTQQIISNDRKMASLSFGLKPLPLDKVQELINGLQSDGQNLSGMKISVVGSMALGAGTINSVLGNRLTMDILCLAAIFIVLLIIYRRFSRAFFIILPIALVIGWSSLVMFATGIPLNPLTAVLGVITTAIGTEFMVLLASRYEEERSKGEPPRNAMLIAASKMGRAIVVTGVTTLGGFGVLIASNFVMIRDFGLITLVGILLCVISAIMVMPSLMVWFDERKKKAV